MAKRRTGKTLSRTKKVKSSNRLEDAVRKLAPNELADFVIEFARSNSTFRQKLTSQFGWEPSNRELFDETSKAIADATDFDEREMNRNFRYDDEAYEVVKRNFGKLVQSGRLRDAMALSLELISQGSYQVECSDEGLMRYEIEDCLKVVIEALQRADLPDAVVRKWCDDMMRKDRTGFIGTKHLHALKERLGAAPSRCL